jgi:hypothetical protein
MRHAAEYFAKAGYDVTDVHRTHPYDLQADKDDGTLHIEVKGTTSRLGSVFLTRNEVIAARAHPDRAVLYVLHSIAVQIKDDRLTAVGGRRAILWPWNVDEGHLEPTEYRYDLPTISRDGER